MTYRELDTIVLLRDLPDAGLLRGDTGTIVHVYAADAFEVEFVRASGVTAAVLELSSADMRPASDNDQLSVRSAGSPSAAV